MSTDRPELPPELEALVLAVLEARVKDARAAARASIERAYAEGDKRTVRSPLDGSKLGSVYRTDPDPAWRIVDRDLLAAHLAEDPENVEYVYELASEAAAIDYLAEHAPELLVRVERVRDAAFDDAVAEARESFGQTDVPGVRRVKPRGSLVVRPDKAAPAAIEALVRAGWITWDGQPKQLAADTEEVAS